MRYLFISPHVDDADLMAGGTIAKAIENGHEVNVVTLSTVYEGIDLYSEWLAAMDAFGVDDCHPYPYDARKFDKHANDILQTLFSYSGYDYVFAPARDFHSDHTIVAKAALRAFKHSNLLVYQADWNRRDFIKNYFVKLEDRHVQKKLDALKCYKSQQDRPYFKEEYLLGNLHVNGMMANCKYAEAFQVINFNA